MHEYLWNIHTNDSSSSLVNIQKLTMSQINLFKALCSLYFIVLLDFIIHT